MKHILLLAGIFALALGSSTTRMETGNAGGTGANVGEVEGVFVMVGKRALNPATSLCARAVSLLG